VPRMILLCENKGYCNTNNGPLREIQRQNNLTRFDLLYNQFWHTFRGIRDSPSCESRIYVTVYIVNRVSIRKTCTERSIRSDTLLWLPQTKTHLRKPLFSLFLDLISRWKSFSFPIQDLLESVKCNPWSS
jgi:hypothetical protein